MSASSARGRLSSPAGIPRRSQRVPAHATPRSCNQTRSSPRRTDAEWPVDTPMRVQLARQVRAAAHVLGRGRAAVRLARGALLDEDPMPPTVVAPVAAAARSRAVARRRRPCHGLASREPVGVKRSSANGSSPPRPTAVVLTISLYAPCSGAPTTGRQVPRVLGAQLGAVPPPPGPSRSSACAGGSAGTEDSAPAVGRASEASAGTPWHRCSPLAPAVGETSVWRRRSRGLSPRASSARATVRRPCAGP
jgi:hypothetical protein